MDITIQSDVTGRSETKTLLPGVTVIGRARTCDVVLESPFVSSTHSRIFTENGVCTVESCGLNGTFVNGVEIKKNERRKLSSRDEIRIGEFLLLMSDSRKQPVRDESQILLNKKFAELKMKVHADLLSRLDLKRMDGPAIAGDETRQKIDQKLEAVLDNYDLDEDKELRGFIVKEAFKSETLNLVLLQGKSRRSAGASTSVTERGQQSSFSEAIRSSIDQFCRELSLSQKPEDLREDIQKVEAGFEALFKRRLPEVSPSLTRTMFRRLIKKDITDIIFGLGPLQDLMDLPNINEIMVVSKDQIFVEKSGVIEETGRSFVSDEVTLSIIDRIVSPIGRRIDRSMPLVDARLPDGSRVNAVIPPLSLKGPCITIRKFSKDPFTIDDLVQIGSINQRAANFLKSCVVGKKNIIVSGGTGSGKTTFLNVLSAFIPTKERIVTIEDSAELQLVQRHVVSLETKPPNIEGTGAFTIRDLVRNALRMRPDRIIVGECRGGEALDMLQAMNTGHDGSMTTGHSNSPQDMLLRLETMVLMALDLPVRAIREQIAAALHLVVQLNRYSEGSRVVTRISEVANLDEETGQIVVEDIFVYQRPRAQTATDSPRGELMFTGYIPTFMDELLARKLMALEEIF